MLLVLASGCNRIFGLDKTEPFDAPPPRPDAVGCAGKAFVGPDVLTEFDAVPNRSEFDPTENADGTELWFSSREAAGNAQDLSWSTKIAATGKWGPSTVAPFNLPGVTDADPALSDDGLRLVFMSDRLGSLRAWEVARTAVGQPFGGAAILRGIDGIPVDGLDMTLDGLTLYFSAANDGELHVAHRSSVDAPFVAEEEGGALRVLANGVAYPSISPDGREVFYGHPGGGSATYRRVRGDTSQPFEVTEEVIYNDADDPEISADGRRLYFARSGALLVARRDCP